MAFSEETYAVLNKKLASVTSGIATYEIVGNQLVMTTTDGQTLTYTFTQPKDGVGIDDISISGSGNTRTLTFTMTDGTTKTVDIPVVKGDKGDKGDGISTMQVVDNHLIVTLTDGTEIDCGLIDVTTSMANLEDVDVSTVENGQILIYDSTTNTWKNGSPSATSTSLDDLSNVNIDTITLQNGQIIKYDAVNQVWVNADSINIESLNDINDVNIVNIQDGQVIAYDSTNQKWVNTNAIAKLRDMTDVELTNLSELNMLRYDSVNNKWVNFDADTTVTDGSTNVVTSGAVYTELQNKSDKATTLSGYGITDSYTKTEEDTLLNAKADKSTTLDGYGITDAYTKTETDTLLDGKVDKNGTDSLMTQAEHTKLEGIESGAEVNVQANWNQTDTEADNYIQNKPTLGTASEKNYTNYVSPTSSDLVISSSVYSAIDSAVSSVYEPYGNLTCAELTQDLLVQENVGHVYNITDSGTTTNLFIGGAGQTINPSDGVVIVRNGESFAYNLIGQLINLTAYQKKELDTPLEIGGTTQTNLESALGALSTEKADKATTLSGYGITNAYTKSETNAEITNAINDLDVTDEYVSNQFISSVSETNGKIDVTRQQLSTTPTLDVYAPISSHGVKKALNSEITPINNKIGNTSISTIGDGTITNAISELDSNLKNNTRTNLINPTAQTTTINGVTFTNNGDGTYTVNGTPSENWASLVIATTDIKSGCKLVGCPRGGGATSFALFKAGSIASEQKIDYGNGVRIESDESNARFSIIIYKGYTANNLVFKPMLTTDLSATYDDFVAYSGDGELNENVAEIYAKSNSAEDALQNEGYKYPIINGVKNYTDSNGVYHKNLGVVDLGTLGWNYTTQYNYFLASIPTIKTRTSNIECAIYKTYSTNLPATSLPNMGIKVASDGTSVVFIRNTTYTDATAFKNAMSGVLLFYELETPQTWNSKSEISRVSDETRTNLLKPTAQTQTRNGVTFTNNGDGTYTVNGTANAQAYILATSSPADLIPFRGKYIRIAGCPTGGGANAYQFNLIISDASDTDINRVIDYGEGSTYYVPSNAHHAYVVIAVQNGYTANNLLFKPMITTDLSATYNDFVQYSGDGELNENVAEIYKVSDRVSDETYTNLLNPTVQTQTKNGVTFTNNGDGTYTVNGTANGNTLFALMKITDFSILKNAKLVGCPRLGTASTYRLYMNCYKGSTGIKDYSDWGNGVIVSNIPSEADYIILYIMIWDGYTADNLLFKPMITTKLDATYDDFVRYTGGSGRLNEDVAEINSKLSVVGNKYYTTTLMTSSVPATTQTIVLQLSNLPIGVYVAVGRISGSTTTTVDGGLIEMTVSSGENVSTPIKNTNFYINGTISNVFEVTSETNTVDVSVFTTTAQTITNGRLTAVRIA